MPSPQRFHNLQEQLAFLLTPTLFLTHTEYEDFSNLVTGKKLIKNDNPFYHCDVMFIPFNPKTKEIFIVHHKKAKQWIVPGGHIEKDELLEDAVRREVREELGIAITNVGTPFLFSVIAIHNDGQSCKKHYDIWYVLPTDEVNVNLTEFHEANWVSREEAKRFIIHKTYLQVLEKMPK